MFGRAQLSKTFFHLWRISRRLWVRAALLAGLAILVAIAAPTLSVFVPSPLSELVEISAVSKILNILATSMLSVTIFSLSVLVSARQAAASQVTPRSHQVLLEDTTTQNVLATFLGSFIFALTASIAIDTKYYTGGAATVVLAIALTVAALVVIAILRWIDHLGDLGSMRQTSARIEKSTIEAIRNRRELPCLGARPLTPGQLEIPARALHFDAWDTGYVQHIDLRRLSRAARDSGGSVFIVAQPGELVSPGEPLVYHTTEIDDDKLRSAFTISDHRVFEQDPRFGVIVMSEIAQRALSPGVNDPGTAIDILTRLARVLAHYRAEENPDCEPKLANIWMSPVTSDELVRDAFDPIARDGAATFEVQVRLLKTLALIAHSGESTMQQAAQAAGARAVELATQSLPLQEQRDRIRDLGDKI